MKNKFGFKRRTKKDKDRIYTSNNASDNIQLQDQTTGFKAKNILIDLALEEQTLPPLSIKHIKKKQEQNGQNISKWDNISLKMSFNATSLLQMPSQRLTPVINGVNQQKNQAFLRTLSKNNSLFHKSPKFCLLKLKRKQFFSETILNLTDNSKEQQNSISQKKAYQNSKSCCIKQIQMINVPKKIKREGRYLERKCLQLSDSSKNINLFKNNNSLKISNKLNEKKDKKNFDIIYRTHKLKKPQLISITPEIQKISLTGHSLQQHNTHQKQS